MQACRQVVVWDTKWGATDKNNWINWKEEKRCGIQRSLQRVFASLQWAYWQVAGSSHCRTSPGSQECRCGGLSTGRACVHCWRQSELNPGNSDQCSHVCPDLLPSIESWHIQRKHPYQQGKGNNARILCHPVGLTSLCASTIPFVLHCI